VVRSIALSPDGRRVVVPGDTTEVWDVDSGERTASLDNGPYSAGGLVALSASGNALALAATARVRWWPMPEAATARDGDEPDGELLWSIALSPDGGLVAAGNPNGLIHLWDAHTGARRASYPDQPHHVWSLAFDGAGTRLASGGDTDVVVRALDGDAPPLVIHAHRDRVEGIRFARGGELLVSASRDQTITIHDARTGALRATIFPTAADGWVIIDAEQHVDGDEGGASLLDWHVGDVILPGFVGWQRNHRPDLLREVLVGPN